MAHNNTINSDRKLFLFNTHYELNNGIHSRSLPLYSCLFNITILWDYPVQSNTFTWWSSFNRYQSTEWSSITHFYFECWIKLDFVSLDLWFNINSLFSFLTSITQRIGTCWLHQSGLWWNDGNESIDDWILNQWPGNGGKGFGTNKQSKHWIFNDHWMKWNEMEWMCRSNDGITDCFREHD